MNPEMTNRRVMITDASHRPVPYIFDRGAIHFIDTPEADERRYFVLDVGDDQGNRKARRAAAAQRRGKR